MRNVILFILFCSIFFVFFKIAQWIFNTFFGISPLVAVIQIIVLFVMFIVTLLLTHYLGRWVK